ncbi:MAG TPA: hypothetical protein VJN42_09140 [Candidatus Acidoferrum sp.]|nr:hypothetical protein [Candidatus Acidoferrum sp.]
MARCLQLLIAAALSLVFGFSTTARQKPDSANLPDAPAPKQNPNDIAQEPPGKTPLESSVGLIARRSWFYPELARTPGALTSGKKFELFLDKSLSPPQILSSLAGAGVSQASDSLHQYGQGADGYAKRFGSSMASGASSHFFGTFLLPAVLHDDPRFFVKMSGGTKVRVGNALRRVFVIRRDNGGMAFNFPGTLGPLAAEALANTYLPDSERTVPRTFRRFGVRVGWGAANNILKEYWPTIFKNLRIAKVAPGLRPEPPPAPPGRFCREP